MDSAEIERMTLQHFPEPFWKDAVRMTYTAHGNAFERVTRDHAPSEHQPMMGYERRAFCEEGIRAVGDKHGIQYEIVPQHGGGPWNHTELSSGPVTVTTAALGYPMDKLDPSEYRLSLAGSANLQFEGLEDRMPADTPLYAVLAHTRYQWISVEERREREHLPGSVYILFPNKDLEYVHVVNLFARFPDVVKAMTPQDWGPEDLRLYIARSWPTYKSRRIGR